MLLLVCSAEFGNGSSILWRFTFIEYINLTRILRKEYLVNIMIEGLKGQNEVTKIVATQKHF